MGGGAAGSGFLVLRISSEQANKMEAKIKTPKNPKASNKTYQKSKRETPRKFHAEILSLNH